VRCVLAAVEQKRVHILCEKHKIVQRAWRVWRQVASSEATWRRPANCTKFNNHGCPPHPLARIAAALRLEGHESIDTEIHLISLGCPETAEYHPAIHPAIHTHKHTHKHTHTHTHTHTCAHTLHHTPLRLRPTGHDDNARRTYVVGAIAVVAIIRRRNRRIYS